MAADAGQRRGCPRARAVRGVVRAARAVVRHALRSRARCRASAASLASRNARRCWMRSLVWKRAIRRAITRAIMRRRQLGRGRQQPARRGGSSPLALLVELADHARAHVLAPVVELLLELVLDDAGASPRRPGSPRAPRRSGGCPRARAATSCRPCRRAARSRRASSSSMPRSSSACADVEIGLAGGDDAEPRRAGCRSTMRSSRLARAIGQRGVDLVLLQPRFLLRAAGRASGCSGRPAACRSRRAARSRRGAGRHRPRTRSSRPCRSRTLNRDPAAGIARHRPAVHAEIEDSPARPPGSAPGSSPRRRRARTGAAVSTTWRHGRRRPAPARRHAARCRRRCRA